MPSERPDTEERRPRFSLAGTLLLILGACVVLMAAFAAWSTRWNLPPLAVFLVNAALGLGLGAWLLGRLLRPLRDLVRALSDGVSSLRDRDFSLQITAGRRDELGQLARRYNEAVAVLREERSAVRQKELLLESALAHSPVATILVGPTGRVLFSNREARRLILGGRRLEERSFDELLAGCPAELRELVSGQRDGIFTVEERPGESEVFHLAQRRFLVNRQAHTLVLLRRMTADLRRQESEIWKKVIRTISHELNNSLAPISSLVHSAQVSFERPEHRHRLRRILESIEERITHLARFLDGYARFARLPRPRPEPVAWDEFLEELRPLFPFRIDGGLPAEPGHFDRGQMQQVLINLLKNADEASEGSEGILVRVEHRGEGAVALRIVDRGRGMSEEVLRQALLPFYSTKKAGSGLGLPLCREIVEAHGGRLGIESRPGEGTTVTCWLPGASQSARDAASAPGPPSSRSEIDASLL